MTFYNIAVYGLQSNDTIEVYGVEFNDSIHDGSVWCTVQWQYTRWECMVQTVQSGDSIQYGSVRYTV